jgi:hypothetical protein
VIAEITKRSQIIEERWAVSLNRGAPSHSQSALERGRGKEGNRRNKPLADHRKLPNEAKSSRIIKEFGPHTF